MPNLQSPTRARSSGNSTATSRSSASASCKETTINSYYMDLNKYVRNSHSHLELKARHEAETSTNKHSTLVKAKNPAWQMPQNSSSIFQALTEWNNRTYKLAQPAWKPPPKSSHLFWTAHTLSYIHRNSQMCKIRLALHRSQESSIKASPAPRSAAWQARYACHEPVCAQLHHSSNHRLPAPLHRVRTNIYFLTELLVRAEAEFTPSTPHDPHLAAIGSLPW